MAVPDPGPALYHLVKRGLSAQGYSIARWCTEQSENRTHLAFALQGKRNGPDARRLRSKAVVAAKIDLLEELYGGPDAA